VLGAPGPADGAAGLVSFGAVARCADADVAVPADRERSHQVPAPATIRPATTSDTSIPTDGPRLVPVRPVPRPRLPRSTAIGERALIDEKLLSGASVGGGSKPGALTEAS
jgi:hypothetical protein